MRHPDLIGLISEGSTAGWHSYEQIHPQNVDLAAGDLLKNIEPGRIGHHIERPDFIGGTPWTLCRHILGDLRVSTHAPNRENHDRTNLCCIC